MKKSKKFRWLDSYYNDRNGLQIETTNADFLAKTQKQNGSRTIRVDLYAGEFLDVAVHVAEKTKFGEYVSLYEIDYQNEFFELVAYAEGEVDGKLKQKIVVWDVADCVSLLDGEEMQKNKLVEAYINAEDGETKIYKENFGYMENNLENLTKFEKVCKCCSQKMHEIETCECEHCKAIRGTW